jgi:hypothetical protein
VGSLIHLISQLSDARYGVNILEETPPGGVRGVGTNVVAVVGHFPWGPIDEATDITSNGELFDAFAPTPFDVLDDWAALKSFINKTFPNTVKVVRVSPAAAVKATYTFDDAVAADSVVVTAKYFGSVGNQIKVAWSANADDPTARDATVTIGTSYTATYTNVATIVAAALVVTDPGDPYVTFAAAGAATAVPAAIAATSLATGADGTPVAGDYSTAIEVLADASVEFSVGFVAEPDASLIDDVNEAIELFVNTHHKGFWVYCTPAAQSSSTAQTYVSARRTDRTTYTWPRVKTINAYDPDREEITVDGAAFAAVAIASVEPHKSPGGAPGARYLKGITGLEQGASLTTLNTLVSKGITPWYMSTALEGAILHNAVTTSLTAGLTKVFRRRKFDHLVQSMAAFLEHFVGEPLDIDLDNQELGNVTGPEIKQLESFLDDEERNGRIADWDIDAFSQNTASNIANGQWIILVAVTLVAAQEQIVLRARIGESVVIDQAA